MKKPMAVRLQELMGHIEWMHAEYPQEVTEADVPRFMQAGLAIMLKPEPVTCHLCGRELSANMRCGVCNALKKKRSGFEH